MYDFENNIGMEKWLLDGKVIRRSSWVSRALNEESRVEKQPRHGFVHEDKYMVVGD